MGNVTTVGIDLAKNVFSLHGVDASGAVVLRKTVSRARLMETVAQQPVCLIGLEACSGAHEWARRFQALGHTVKLMAPRFVAPYRKNGKNDGNDAEAICEAVTRPSMRFVPIKTLEQQAVLCLHRVRQGFVEERTATINRLRVLDERVKEYERSIEAHARDHDGAKLAQQRADDRVREPCWTAVRQTPTNDRGASVRLTSGSELIRSTKTD